MPDAKLTALPTLPTPTATDLLYVVSGGSSFKEQRPVFGTPNTVPLFTGTTTLGDSLLYQDTTHRIVVAAVQPTTTPSDLTNFLDAHAYGNSFAPDSIAIIPRASTVHPILFFLRSRGTYAAKSKVLAGDTLGQIFFNGCTSSASFSGPSIYANTLQDGDTVPFPACSLTAHVSTTPEFVITAGAVTVRDTLAATNSAVATGLFTGGASLSTLHSTDTTPYHVVIYSDTYGLNSGAGIQAFGAYPNNELDFFLGDGAGGLVGAGHLSLGVAQSVLHGGDGTTGGFLYLQNVTTYGLVQIAADDPAGTTHINLYSPSNPSGLPGGLVDLTSSIATPGSAVYLRFLTPNDGASGGVAFHAPDAIAGNATLLFTWPNAKPTVTGQSLVSDTTGAMSWGTGVVITTGGSTTISTGVGSVAMSSANPATNTAWIPITYAGTTYFVPGWTTNSP